MSDDFIVALSHNSTLSKTETIKVLVNHFPYRTAQELATKINSNVLSSEQIHKRLPELRKKGLVRNSTMRKCTITGKFVYTWAPAVVA